MLQLPGVVLALCLYLGSDPSTPDPGGAAPLMGTWDDVTPEPSLSRKPGFRLPIARHPVTFDGSACTWGDPGGRAIRRTFFVPVKAGPGPGRGIDFLTLDGERTWITRALYRIVGDTLTIAEGAVEAPRPSELAARPFDASDATSFVSRHVYRRRAN